MVQAAWDPNDIHDYFSDADADMDVDTRRGRDSSSNEDKEEANKVGG